MNNTTHNSIVSFIWGIADDVLRDVYVRGKYRGAMPEWNGIYLYGDYCTGFIWGLMLVEGQWHSQVVFSTNVSITSFGQDDAGEVYLASDAGDVYMLVEK